MRPRTEKEFFGGVGGAQARAEVTQHCGGHERIGEELRVWFAGLRKVPCRGEIEVEHAAFFERAQTAMAAEVGADFKGTQLQVVMGGLH